ncbi:MAG TPA: HlyD family efflux transporter periplasmic adaptor subunit [Myxococcales bacterium]|jgi:membrane fusion protein (multidrug efflux system)|nr:HlyD family efflux transporter periplasmic adaptor subunit [Myxococcales bacterium]
MRSFDADAFRVYGAVLIVAIVILASWLTWSVAARVSVVQVSSAGRVESVSAVHQVESAVAGQVVSAPRKLGEAVDAGDLLVELDSRPQQIQLERTRAQLKTQQSELALLQEQIAAENDADRSAGRADQAALQEAEAKRAELLPKLELTEERRKLVGDAPNGIVSPIESLERKSEDESARRSAATSTQTLTRLSADQALSRRRRDLHLQELHRDSVKLEGELPVLAATIAGLEDDIARHRIRATAKGRLGQIAELTPGAFVKLGDRLAVVVSEGDLHVRASFTPETAVGVLREGQHARMRFPGYPWPIYGTVAGTVTSVGTEPLSGMIAVELSLQQEASSWIKLQHGLPAEVEVQVDRVSPATLVLRAIGHATSFARAAPPAEAKP